MNRNDIQLNNCAKLQFQQAKSHIHASPLKNILTFLNLLELKASTVLYFHEGSNLTII